MRLKTSKYDRTGAITLGMYVNPSYHDKSHRVRQHKLILWRFSISYAPLGDVLSIICGECCAGVYVRGCVSMNIF
jgi:hypothetical protein